MVVAPSCNALLIHDDGEFRRRLIATLDVQHFSVAYAADGDEALRLIDERMYEVVLVGVELKTKKGLRILDYLKDHREHLKCGVIVIGEADPALRTFAPWVDETLMKPVDADYVAQRARTYCSC